METLEDRIVLAVTPGDFSLDNGVDNTDLAIWQSAYNANDTADADGDGLSTGLDFLIWQQNFGQPSGVCPPDPTPENVTVVLDTGFTSAEGYVGDGVGGDDPLPFQSPAGAGTGTWLGQTNAQVNAAGTGTVTSVGGPFDRNTYSAGANGGSAGGGGTLTTSDFTPGDQLRITFDYQFTLSANATVELASIGFRDGFGTTEGQSYGFNAVPQQGWDSEYNAFGSGIGTEPNVGGSVKFFPDKADSVNADALIIDGNDLGVDPNNGLGGGVDLISDNLQITYVASYNGGGNWSVDSLSVENLDTSTTFDYAGPTQSFDYFASYTGAPANTPAADAFYAQQLAINSDASFLGVADGAKFELIEAVPIVTNILSAGFTTTEGYVGDGTGGDDPLPFQNPASSGTGTWLGQTSAQVDAGGSGTVTSVGGAFDRNTYSAGATGGSAGGAGTLTTSDFVDGEQLRIVADYQFTLSTNGTIQLATIGFRDGFATTEGQDYGFDADVLQGWDSEYNAFGSGIGTEPNVGGSVKFFPDKADTANADALLIDGNDLGLDPNNGLGGGVDLTSDNLRITYIAETDGAGTWTVVELSVENLDTSTTFDYSGPAQTFSYFESWAGATPSTPAKDAFYAQQLAPNPDAGFSGVIDAVTFDLLTPPPIALSTPLDTDFTSADGYTGDGTGGDDDLQFQEPNGGGNGIWLGQDLAQVDSGGSGTVSSVGGPSDRNVWSLGLTGGSAGGGGTLTTGDFQLGDQISMTSDYQFTLSGNTNTDLAAFGFRDGFGVTQAQDYGFDASPQQGWDSDYNAFGSGIGTEPNVGGSVKFFPDLADSANADALIINGNDLGIDPNDGLGNGVDLVSDNLQISYVASYNGSGNWTVDSFSVVNLDTSSVFEYSGPSQSYDYFESWALAPANTPAKDAFYAQQLAANSDAGFTGVTNAAKFQLLDPAPVGPGPLLAASASGGEGALDVVGIAQFMTASAEQPVEQDAPSVDPAFAAIALDSVSTYSSASAPASQDSDWSIDEGDGQDEEAVDFALAGLGDILGSGF